MKKLVLVGDPAQLASLTELTKRSPRSFQLSISLHEESQVFSRTSTDGSNRRDCVLGFV